MEAANSGPGSGPERMEEARPDLAGDAGASGWQKKTKRRGARLSKAERRAACPPPSEASLMDALRRASFGSAAAAE